MLTGRPILDATTTVIAEASSMLKPLNSKKKNIHVLSLLCISDVGGGAVIRYKYVAYLEGVIGVRSFPRVWITLRPHTQRPAQMPTPPYRSNQMGVGALDTTEPLSYTSQRATSGPIALLLNKKITYVNPHNPS